MTRATPHDRIQTLATMFGQSAAMQLSAANLLIASQQIARGAQQVPRDTHVQFAAAMAKEKSAAGAASFEPMDFKQATPEQPPAAAAALRPVPYGQSGPLGANIDIRV